MSRVSRVAAAILLGVVALSSSTLASPSPTRACSCVPWPETLAAYRTDADVLILSGTVVAMDGQRGQFGIERVFKGSVSGPAMPIQMGDAGMCGLSMEVGQRWILATTANQGVLQPSICMPSADLLTPQGDELLADAEASYGGVIPPPGEAVEPGGDPERAGNGEQSAPLVGLAGVLGGVLVVVVLLFGSIAFVSRQARRE